MKTTRQEKLANHLTELDENLLNTAYEIDDAQKLAAYQGRKSSPFYKTPLFRRLTALAACLAVALTAVFTLQPLFPAESPATSAPSEEEKIVLPPVRVGTEGTFKAEYDCPYLTVENLTTHSDAVVRIRIKNWIAEFGYYTYYEAEVLDLYAGSIQDTFILQQFGSSSLTAKGEPLYTYGNEYIMFVSKDACGKMNDPYQYPDSNTYAPVGGVLNTLEIVCDENERLFFIDRYSFVDRFKLDISNYYQQVALEINEILTERDKVGFQEREAFKEIYAVDDLFGQ